MKIFSLVLRYKFSIGLVLLHLQVCNDNSSGGYAKTLGYGDPKTIWGINEVISDLILRGIDSAKGIFLF